MFKTLILSAVCAFTLAACADQPTGPEMRPQMTDTGGPCDVDTYFDPTGRTYCSKGIILVGG